MSANNVMRILREVNNYSQAYVASVLDIEQNTYSKLENGQIKLTVDRVKKLAALYKVPVDYLLSEEAPIINYNSGPFSHSNLVVHPKSYTDINYEAKELYEKLLEEKDNQIKLLQKQLEQYIKLVEQLSKKD